MHERQLLPILLGTLAVAPLLARWAGGAMARRLRAVPGQGRRWMPSLPVQEREDGTPAARFDAAVRAAERRAVPLLLAQGQGELIEGLQAEVLAGQLEVPQPIAAALLDGWRRRMPSRMRVTQAGALLYDFRRDAIRSAVADGDQPLLQRVFMMILAIMANLGATWWVVVGVLIGAASLTAVIKSPDQETAIIKALEGIGALLSVFVLSQLGAWLVRLLTLRRAPRMAKPGYRARARARAAKKKAKKASEQPVEESEDEPKKDGSSWTDVLSGLNGIDGEGAGFLLLAVLVVILASALIGGLVIVGVWLRGLWQAARKFGEPVRDTAPAVWLGQAKPGAKWERWVPTNDLAMRLVRALRRTLRQRPADERLAMRVLARARQQNGRVAAVEISLDYGLDPAEAISVGTRLVGAVGGDIEVSEAGDLDFIFGAEALAGQTPALDGADLEYLQALSDNPAQPVRLPVNIPGLTVDHVDGAARLAGGPLATVAVMAATLLGGRGDLPIHGLDLSLGLLFCVLAPGTLVLAAVTRQAVAESAAQGLLRDARRLAIARAREVLQQPAGDLDAGVVTAQIHQQLSALGLQWTEADIAKEVGNAWADLGIEPDLHSRAVQPQWSTGELRQRLGSLETLRSDHTVQRAANSDAIVFDSGPIAA